MRFISDGRTNVNALFNDWKKRRTPKTTMVSTFEREIEFTKTSHGATRIAVQDYGQYDLLLTLSATTIPLSSIFQAEMEKEKFLDDLVCRLHEVVHNVQEPTRHAHFRPIRQPGCCDLLAGTPAEG